MIRAIAHSLPPRLGFAASALRRRPGVIFSGDAGLAARTTSRPAPTARSGTRGQRKGYLGRLDPKTGKDENIPIGTGSAPHGVIVGPDGAPGSPTAG